MAEETQPLSRRRRLLRRALRVVLAGAALLLIALLALFGPALVHRFWSFPREARAWAAIRAARVEVTLDDGRRELRGAVHAHSRLSHDSIIEFPEILAAAKEAEIDFILMADHVEDGIADYSLQWRGVREGVLFVPGFEMNNGVMAWGLPEDAAIDTEMSARRLTNELHRAGGLVAMAHLEEDRRIELPRVFGMEIYNMHQDLAEGSELMVATDILVSHRAFPDRVFRAHFDRPTENLRKWDEALKKKKLFGIAGNDAHQNTGVLARMTDAKEFEFFRTNGDIVVSHRPNWLTRPILRLLFGPLDPGRTLFHFEGGPYVTSLRHVKTHVLAEELTEAAVLEALREGRAFIGFDAVADSTGFVYLAESGERRVVVGESMPWSPGTRLRVASPHACRFTIVRDGETAHRAAGTELDWAADRPGKYRVEAELDVRGEWTPWVYTNPIELTPPDR